MASAGLVCSSCCPSPRVTGGPDGTGLSTVAWVALCSCSSISAQEAGGGGRSHSPEGQGEDLV